MRIVPISTVKDRLEEFVDSASQTHERVTITKDGSPVAILVGMADWEALQETLFWLGRDDNREVVAQARGELADGKGQTEQEIRAEFSDHKRGNDRSAPI